MVTHTRTLWDLAVGYYGSHHTTPHLTVFLTPRCTRFTPSYTHYIHAHAHAPLPLHLILGCCLCMRSPRLHTLCHRTDQWDSLWVQWVCLCGRQRHGCGFTKTILPVCAAFPTVPAPPTVLPSCAHSPTPFSARPLPPPPALIPGCPHIGRCAAHNAC